MNMKSHGFGAFLAILAVGSVGCTTAYRVPTPSWLDSSRVPMAGSGSMLPVIPAASCYVEFKRTAYADLKEGDIALYYNVWIDRIVIHRVVRKATLANGWVMKGDANERVDRGLCTKENFYGTSTGSVVGF